MSTNICGNCENFKPRAGDRFFNCTSARHAGVSYGMQVRVDTRACDAFLPFKAPPPPTPKPPTAKARAASTGRTARPTGLCAWGRLILIIAIVIAILLISWLAYTCASKTISSPTPTPTQIPAPTTTTPAVTSIGPPTAAPTPTYNTQYFNVGPDNWAATSAKAISISSAFRASSYGYGGYSEKSPPGTQFVMISVTASNRLNSPTYIGASDFFLIDSSGVVYYSLPQNKPYYISKPFPGYIGAGGTILGNILYLVPSFVSGLEIRYLIEPSSAPPTIAAWKLP